MNRTQRWTGREQGLGGQRLDLGRMDNPALWFERIIAVLNQDEEFFVCFRRREVFQSSEVRPEDVPGSVVWVPAIASWIWLDKFLVAYGNDPFSSSPTMGLGEFEEWMGARFPGYLGSRPHSRGALYKFRKRFLKREAEKGGHE